MSTGEYTSPQTREQVLNTYFLEHRARLLDVASFLDRLDRARPAQDTTDFREAAFRKAAQILCDGQPHRCRRILELLSDHTTELPQSADGMKGAAGAVRVSDSDATMSAKGVG